MARIVRTNTADFADTFRQIIGDDKPGLLCGSAVSIFAPTALEGGHVTSKNVASHLCDVAGINELCKATGARISDFKRAVEDAAYEVILQQHPKKAELPHLFQSYFLRHGSTDESKRVAFSATHEALADLLADGKISGIVTTNYDTCIESAYRAKEGRPTATVIVDRPEARSERPIFKLHGCAQHPNSMIFSLDQEFEMPAWKKAILADVANDHLVVIGYSGLDFEVCPELYDLKVNKITWIALEKAGRPVLSVNARRVLSKYRERAVVLSGDLQDVLVAWTGKGRCERGGSNELLSKQLFDCLSPSERRLWAARTFVTLSIPSAAENAIKLETQSLSPGEELDESFKRVELGVLNHSMHYFDNSDKNHALSRDETRDLISRIESSIGESGSSWMGGVYDRCQSALGYAKELADRVDDLEYKESTEQGIEWMSLLLSKRTLQRDDRHAVGTFILRLRALQDRAYRTGNHHLIDLCEEEISQISKSKRKRPERRMKKRSGQLFKQLGNYVGQVTALHTQVLKTKSSHLAKRLHRRAPLMVAYGLPPWRVYQTLINFEPDVNEREVLFEKFRSSIEACQFHEDYLKAMIEKSRMSVAHPDAIKV